VSGRSGNRGSFIRSLVVFFILVAIIWLPQWFPPLTYLAEYFRRRTGFNWVWPLSLFLGILAGSFLLKVHREAETQGKLLWAGILFVFLLQFCQRGIPSPRINNMTMIALCYQFFASFLEEFLFRRIGFVGLRAHEEKFYSEPYLKRLAPASLIFICLIYGLAQGYVPFGRGGTEGGFYPDAYAAAFRQSVQMTFLYILTRSVWVTGFSHFLTNIQKFVW